MSKIHPTTVADRYIAQLKHDNVQNISLAGNDITDDNIGSFVSALVDNKSVTYLALFCVQGGNTCKGSTMLAASAMSLSSLRTLSWSNIFDGSKHAVKILSHGLRSSATLNRVLLTNSKFTSAEIRVLTDALSVNTSVKTLGLEGCGVSDDGARRVSNMLKSNRTLQTVSLSENGITDVGAETLLEAIYDTTSFDSIWNSNHVVSSFSRSTSEDGRGNSMVKFNHVSDDMKHKICEILNINRESRNPARQKVTLHLERNPKICMSQDIDTNAIPDILSWCGRTASFEMLRNMPEILTHAVPINESQREELPKKTIDSKIKATHKNCSQLIRRVIDRSKRRFKPKKTDSQRRVDGTPRLTMKEKAVLSSMW
jgi:hypothetical protein